MDQPARPSVLYVSKPIVPPYRDGSKCLVRDLCLHLPQIRAQVMSTEQGSPELTGRALTHAVYRDAGHFAPSLRQNLQAFSWLSRSPQVDLWHSVFAPNRPASGALGWLSRLRGAAVCQTIASPPKSFEHPERLLFGQIVVAQSAWTLHQFLNAYQNAGKAPPTLIEIPPPCPVVVAPEAGRMMALRQQLGVGVGTPLFTYPGDLEARGVGLWLLDWSKAMRQHWPEARLILAYRTKTPRSREVAEQLRRQADHSVVQFVENVSDIWALIQTSSAVVFPVEDLYGKVDLPLILLEAMSLGTPVLALGQGPLKSLKGAQHLPWDQAAWLQAALALKSPELRTQWGGHGRQEVRRSYDAHIIARSYWEVYQELLARRAAAS
jgi:phosphatidylinositol alpha-1,6-mannosyltransferase